MKAGAHTGLEPTALRPLLPSLVTTPECVSSFTMLYCSNSHVREMIPRNTRHPARILHTPVTTQSLPPTITQRVFIYSTLQVPKGGAIGYACNREEVGTEFRSSP